MAITRKLFIQAPPADDGYGAFGELLAAYLNDFFIQMMKAAATTFWFLEKIAAGINRFLTEEDMWDRVLDSTMSTLEGTMPAILQGVIFSSDAGGIIYIALFMAGLLMIIPSVNHLQFVDPTRAITWAIVIVVLFISASSNSGYDLIGLVEQMRAGAVQLVVESTDEGEGLDKLVAQPMMANESDLEDYGWVLAGDFEEEYFPEATDYQERNVIIAQLPFYTWQTSFEVESEEGQKERLQKAETGLAISALTIVAAFVLLMFGVIFATLTASALILIVFFLVSLPLGFFEFGASILNGILKQYAYLWAITLLAVILPSILVAAGTLAYPDSGPPTPAQIMAFIPILIIVTIATSYVSAMAAKAMTDTFSVISTSISTAMAPLNYAGRMPAGGMLGGGLKAGANVAATAALAAATGGAGAALMAGSGSMMGQISEGGGAAVGALATGVMGSRANVFASAARGRGAAQVAGVAGRNRRKRNQEIKNQEKNFAKAHQEPTDLEQDSWDAIDAGNYLTTNRNQLVRAEEAYTRGQYTTARNHLTYAFGSREVAHQVMQHYGEHGQTGMQQVRQIVETTQDTAAIMAQGGERLFNSDGSARDEFKKRTIQKLHKSKNFDPTNPAQAALSAAVSGAVVRSPVHLANHDLLASYGLAQTVLDPTNPKIGVSDQSALLALHDYVNQLGLNRNEVETIFEATREGQAVALSGKQTGVDAVVQRMGMHGELAYMDTSAQREMARLALLITRPASHHQSNTIPFPTRPLKTALFDTTPLPTQPLSPSAATSPTAPNRVPTGTMAPTAPTSSQAPAPSGTALDMYLGTARTNPTQASNQANQANQANAKIASSTAVTNAAVASSASATFLAPVAPTSSIDNQPPPSDLWNDQPSAAWDIGTSQAYSQSPPPPPPPPPSAVWDIGTSQVYSESPPPPPPPPDSWNDQPPAWDIGTGQAYSESPPPPPPDSWNDQPPAWDVGASQAYSESPPPPPPPDLWNDQPPAWDIRTSQATGESPPPPIPAGDTRISQVSPQASNAEVSQAPSNKPNDDIPSEALNQEPENEPTQLPIKTWDQVSVEETVTQSPTFHQLSEDDQ